MQLCKLIGICEFMQSLSRKFAYTVYDYTVTRLNDFTTIICE